ncbi:MAG: hypothetical protein ACE5I2_14445, partial [Anaerolineae bacterium]
DVTNVGMNVDVRRYVVSAASRTGERDLERAYVLTTGALASAAEHSVFQLLQQARSVSAVKLISEANNRGIPVFGIDATNVDLILPQLNVSSDVLNDVRNAVAAGKQVLIPQENVPLLNWNGVGYIILDPQTGAGAYLISGGIAGGATVELKQLLDRLRDALAALGISLELLKFFAQGTRFVAKATALAGAIGAVINGISATATAIEILDRTGEPIKALGAFFFDFVFNLLSSWLIGQLALVALAVPLPGVNVVLAILGIVVGSLFLSLLEERILNEILFPPSSLLLQFLMKASANRSSPDLKEAESFPSGWVVLTCEVV